MTFNIVKGSHTIHSQWLLLAMMNCFYLFMYLLSIQLMLSEHY